jgi:hypothetical protein
MLSQAVLQQYASLEQTLAAQELHVVASALPAVQTLCEQEPPPHDSPQYCPTSPTQMLSHCVRQQ